MTLTEKILARAAGKARVQAGDNVWVKADVLMTHDVCGPGTIGVFKREFGKNAKVWDRNKVVIIPDHYIFTAEDRKSTRLNSSHSQISYAVFCLKKKKTNHSYTPPSKPTTS